MCSVLRSEFVLGLWVAFCGFVRLCLSVGTVCRRLTNCASYPQIYNFVFEKTGVKLSIFKIERNFGVVCRLSLYGTKRSTFRVDYASQMHNCSHLIHICAAPKETSNMIPCLVGKTPEVEAVTTALKSVVFQISYAHTHATLSDKPS